MDKGTGRLRTGCGGRNGGHKGTGSGQKWEGILGSLLSPARRCLCSPPPRDANAPASPVSHTPPLSSCPPTGDSLESDPSPRLSPVALAAPEGGALPALFPSNRCLALSSGGITQAMA